MDSGVRLPGSRSQLCLWLTSVSKAAAQCCGGDWHEPREVLDRVTVHHHHHHPYPLRIKNIILVLFYSSLLFSDKLSKTETGGYFLHSLVMSFFLIRLRKDFDYGNYYQEFESFFPYTKPLAIM